MTRKVNFFMSLALITLTRRCNKNCNSGGGVAAFSWINNIKKRTTVYHQTRLNNNFLGGILLPSNNINSNSIRLMSLSGTNTDGAADAADDAAAVVDIARNLEEVRTNVKAACEKAGRDNVRLVAVSKTKPVEMLRDAYENGNQRVFGENYVQELVEKVPQLPTDITWHFIGSLQSNKANLVVKSVVPTNKLVIETVSSMKLANKLNNAMKAVVGADDAGSHKKLDIYIQINTSGEESKGGLNTIQDTIQICKHIVDNCDYLNIVGLMTIGATNDISCFDTLVEYRDNVANDVSALTKENLQLSMGMSGDYETAIAKGSTNVRVGSTIFGARNYPTK